MKSYQNVACAAWKVTKTQLARHEKLPKRILLSWPLGIVFMVVRNIIAPEHWTVFLLLSWRHLCWGLAFSFVLSELEKHYFFSFNCLCVLIFFLECWLSALFQIFLCHSQLLHFFFTGTMDTVFTSFLFLCSGVWAAHWDSAAVSVRCSCMYIDVPSHHGYSVQSLFLTLLWCEDSPLIFCCCIWCSCM